MRKYILVGMAVILATCSIGFTSYGKDEQPELIKGYATAYNGPSDTTCTGKPVHKGICCDECYKEIITPALIRRKYW